MANEKTTGNPDGIPAGQPAEKAAESEAGTSAERRSGRRGRSQGDRQNKPQEEPQGAPSEEQKGKAQDGQQRSRQTGQENRSRTESQDGQQPRPQDGQQRSRQTGQESRTRAESTDGQQNGRQSGRRSTRSGRADASGVSGTSARSDTPARSGNSNRAAASGRPGDSVRRQAGKAAGSKAGNLPDGRSAGKPGGRGSLHWTWRDYALQLSVVVIGIVVTFVGSDMISRWSRQRQVKMVMQLVVSELEQNRAALVDVCGDLEYDRRGSLMFMEYDDLKSVPADSLTRYALIMNRLPSYRPQQEALEVLKSSDIISAVGDKQFLVDIFGCYNRLNDFRENVRMYCDRKEDALDHLFLNSAGFSLGPTGSYESWKVIMDDPMCAAFIGTSANFFGVDDYFRRTIREVDGVIDAVNKKYGFEASEPF